MPALSALIRIVPEPLATRSISKLSDGMVRPCASMIIGTAPDDAVALGPDREQAAPGRGLLQHRHVAQQPRKIEHEAAAAPRRASQARSPEASCRGRRARRAPRIRPAPRANCGSHRRISCRCSAAPATWPASPHRDCGNVSAAISGLSRSGSENTTSNAITTAPSRVRLVTMSAIRVRGHGHWPSLVAGSSRRCRRW